MNDTTSENAQASEESAAAASLIGSAAQMARDAGVPDKFDDNTAVYLHRTAASTGYVLVAFDPQVLVRWANSEKGFSLLRGSLNFLPMGMPVLSVELSDNDAVETGDEQTGDQQ